MAHSTSINPPHPSVDLDDDDRKSRFQTSPGGTENGNGSGGGGNASHRERAASQPPRSSDQAFLSSPSSQHFIPSSLGGNGSPWGGSRMLSPIRGQPVSIRSSSFSSNPQQNQFSSAMRGPAFPSTFEDDESEGFSDTYDERYVPPSLSRGRSYGQDLSRSRSQSLAVAHTRPGPVGSPYTGSSAMQSWNEPYLTSNTTPLNIPGGRGYGDIKPPGSSRYGSLGTIGRSPTNLQSASPNNGTFVGNGYSRQPAQPDISNMSPFVRDVGQILLDDGSAFRELWAGMHPPRDENGGGGSGTTSRRHSVSVVQPRRGNIVGFSASGSDSPEEPTRPVFQSSAFGRGGLLLSDDDLASDLGLMNINPNEPPPPSSSSSQLPPSQPASLPIYAPLSRSPPSKDLMSQYQSINLTIPSNTYASRQTPSDGGVSAGGSSSPHGFYDQQEYKSNRQQPELTARYVPGQGIQYTSPQQQQQQRHQHGINGPQYTRTRAPSYSSSSGGLTSPISPTGHRVINPQQQPYFPQQMQRRLSDAQQQPPPPSSASSNTSASFADLGKGVPLHAVPSSWPLFIVEFKAGRTDLFYLTDLSQEIHVGDLVIVEADRGKDLGKVVNDSITLAEVEEFQRQQLERERAAAGFGGDGGGGQLGQVVGGTPTSPGGVAAAGGGTPTGKKEINPKRIYGKAGPQDTQLLAAKTQDELKALQLCQSKVRAKKLPMEVIDAEYQWDRRKLTFYFIAEKRIDFRELVRELFRLYKTRIWMASLPGFE
ncbi:hypothetical protein K443DRAFT_676558 [Laccaria amethystina LaAM-08-1]|uniref:PSP1 C-terminal domain-containing protein n=1 Tax=Laccaria amethystina LaAM-08-1 TaxID=1095629 RepID=A0A0C9WVX0_9AGAR|nr:hypothetical protein K443DRAFT_676558 [Laccaria amethystina LaAM-08-1]